MNYLLLYLTIGLVHSILLDIMREFLGKRGLIPQDIYEEWNWVMRTIAIIIWPWAIYKFIRGLIKY